MTDTKKCPSCNEDVPVLAVRCKSCGARLGAAIESLSDGPDLSLSDEPSMIADLDALDDLEAELDVPAMAPENRMSAPPPPRVSAVPGATTDGPTALPSAPPVAGMSSIPPMPKASAAPPPVSAPPPPISRAPSVPPISAPPPAPAGGPGMPKRTMLGMAPPAMTPPGGLPAMGAPETLPSNVSVGSVPNPFDDEPMPASLLSSGASILGHDELDALDLDDDILDDDFEEISKFTEQTAITDVSTLAQGMADDLADDDLPAGLLEDILERSEPESPQAMMEVAPQPALPTPSSPPAANPYGGGLATAQPGEMTQPVLPSELMQPGVPAMPMPSEPPMAKKGLGPMAYGIIALFLLLGVVTAAIVMLSGDEDETEAAAADKAEAAPAEKAGGADAPEETAEKKPEEKPELAAAPETANPEAAADEVASAASAHKCKAIGDYPDFPWADKLRSLISSMNKTSICGLFGVTKEDVATTLRAEPSLGPTGYDLLPGGSVFEVFPLGDAKRRAPTIEYIFVEETLFEIRLKYQMSSADALANDMFAAVIGRPTKAKNDPLNREIRRYEDGDLLIEWTRKEDAYKRVFNEIVFASRIRSESMKDALKKRTDAVVAFEKGMESFNQKKTMRAIDMFRRARKELPTMGMAYIFEGITALQSEDFDKAETAAKNALDASSDDRAKAGAKGLQAVVALFKGDKNAAVELFKNAASLDPTDPEFSTSMKELKTGTYEAARVAKTAARMGCKHNKANWTAKGLLARGNFPDNNAYMAARRKVKRSKAYKDALTMWTSWECN